MRIDKHVRKRFRVKKHHNGLDEWVVLDEHSGKFISFGDDKAEAEHTAKGLNVTDQTLFQSSGQRIFIGKI